ncbi:MAG: hypothetical protein V8T12_02290 [Parabacteroides johnsonii]
MKAVALKLVLRSWWRNKTFSIISIVSLAIGIACTNLLVAFVIYEFNIEADNPNKEKIVYMAQDWPMKSGREKASFIVGKDPDPAKRAIYGSGGLPAFQLDRLQFHHHREQEIRSDLDYQDRHYFRPLLRI